MDIKPVCDILLEKTVLASAIVSESALNEMPLYLTENSFYDNKHKGLARELLKLPSKGCVADFSLLVSKLGDEYTQLITDLMLNISTTSKIANHCKKLKDIENARNLMTRALEVVSRANSSTDYSNYVNWGIDHVASFYEGSAGLSELQHIRNYIPEATKELQMVYSGEIKGMRVGIADVDNASGGFRGGEYVVIAGRPSQGKSSLGLSIIKNVALQGYKIGLFSLEMTGTQNVFKLTSMIAGVDNSGNKRLPHGMFRGSRPITKQGLNAFHESCSVLSEKEIYINTSSASSAHDIENELRRFCKVNSLDAFALDYIGIVKRDSNAEKKAHEQVAEISGKLRGVIKELGVVGFVLVQLNRDSHNKKPTMANLADSTQIERDAHFVYLIHQPDLEDKTKKVIICDKGRDGGEGNFPVHFCTETTEFTSMTEEEGKAYMNSLRGDSKGVSNDEGLAF